MSGFAFPPPPPPPPRSREVSQPEHVQSVSEAHHSHGAPRGRGYGRGTTSHGYPQGLPRGAHFNPNFQPQGQRRPSVPSINSSHASNTVRTSDNQQHSQSRPYQSNPDRSIAGQKRKLDALRGPQHNKDAEPGPQVAPVVPQFGAPIISKESVIARSPTAATTASVSTSSRSLFGIHGSQDLPVDSDSSNDEQDDDVDEEAMYAQLGTKLVFEYEGNVVSLASEADLARWQQERRSRFPTMQRVEAKDAERRLVGAERKRLLDGAYALGRPSWARHPLTHGQPAPSTTAGEQHAVRVPLDSGNDAPSTTPSTSVGILGMDQYGSDDDDDGELDVVHTDDKVLEANDSDDDRPEEVTSKPPIIDTRPACKYYFSTGACKAGDQCKFRHEAHPGQPPAVTQSSVSKQRPKVARVERSRKKGIYQMLMNQENEAADKLALQVIKHLGTVGFFKA